MVTINFDEIDQSIARIVKRSEVSSSLTTNRVLRGVKQQRRKSFEDRQIKEIILSLRDQSESDDDFIQIWRSLKRQLSNQDQDLHDFLTDQWEKTIDDLL